MKNILVFSLLLACLSGCKVEQYDQIYRRTCAESAQIPFSQLNSNSKCNGQALVLAIAKSNDSDLARNLTEDRDEAIKFINKYPEFIKFRDPEFNRTPLMNALLMHNVPAEKILITSVHDLSETDSGGQSIDFYMMGTQPDVARALNVTSAELLRTFAYEEKSFASNALKQALKFKNYVLAWRLITLLKGNLDLASNGICIDDIPGDFFFDPELDQNPNLFGPFLRRLLQPFSGVNYDNGVPTRVQNYSMLHYAAAHNMNHVFNYLLENGAIVDSISSEGSPLAMAFASNWNSTEQFQARNEIIESLLTRREAVVLPDVLNAALKSANPDWVKRVIYQGAPLASYADILFIKDQIEAPGPRPMNYIDSSGNIRSMQIAEMILKDDQLSQGHQYSQIDRTLSSSAELDTRSNGIGQNFADFFFFAFRPNDYAFYAHNFETVLAAAVSHDLMDRQDVLGMLPIHYWLASPHRYTYMNFPDEVVHLRTLLKATKGWSTFNANHDSIISLAVNSGSLALVKEIIRRVPTMRKAILIPNLNGKTPLQASKELDRKDIYDFLKAL